MNEASCTDGRCGTKSAENSCGPKGGCCKESGCEMTDKVMCLADKAWGELMKEKMKTELEKRSGANMSKIAAAAVEAALASWTHKMEGKNACEKSKEKLRDAFTA